MRKIYFIILLIGFPFFVFAQERRNQGEESLFLSMQKVGLGQLSDIEEKKKFLDTVQLEKQKLQHTMLRSIYENAYEFYRSGDYQSSRDMAARILSIDPSFDDARMLKEAAEAANGKLEIMSQEGKGTKVIVNFQLSHIDRKPIGNMADTLITLIAGNPKIDFLYTEQKNGKRFLFHTKDLKEFLSNEINNSQVLIFIRKYLKENKLISNN